jgi:hypothetical protein
MTAMKNLRGTKEIAVLSSTDESKALNRYRIISRIAGEAWDPMLVHRGDYLTAPRLYTDLPIYWSAIFFHLYENMGIQEKVARVAMNGANGAVYNDTQGLEASLQDAVNGIAKGENWCFTVQFSRYADGATDIRSAAHPYKADIEHFGSTSSEILSEITVNLNALFAPIMAKLS